jgi:Flp pilus assembly protein protease CpaA
MILGGGDIKYMMLVAVYLEPVLFPMFLLITGLVQTAFLVYKQYFKKRRIAPMIPAMFVAVVFTEILYFTGLYP